MKILLKTDDMKRATTISAILALAILTLAACADDKRETSGADPDVPNAAHALGKTSPEHAQDTLDLDNWPETARMAAEAMIEKYGEPDESTKSLLIWNDTEPFSRTVVYREEVQHDFPMPHQDVLEQSINYDVPVDRFDDLARYDGSVIVERTKGVMSARCDKEVANYLALNLAHDIIEGNRSVEEARQYYADAIMRMLQGEKDEYLQGLQFDVPTENINNPDETVLDMSRVRELKERQDQDRKKN